MTTTHAVTPEEVMAWVDGELAESEARAIAAHVEECAECAGVAAGFRRMSEELAEWRVEEVPARVEEAVMKAAEAGAKGYSHGRTRRAWGTRRWVVGLGCAAALVFMVVVAMPTFEAHGPRRMDMIASTQPQPSQMPMEERSAAIASLAAPSAPMVEDKMSGGGGQPGPTPVTRGRLPKFADTQIAPPKTLAANTVQPTAPMIARVVSLTVRVQDVDQSRAAVEAMLARHHGYAAQMNANTAEGSARTFTASLRIPAGELAAALRELRGLGHVENESQSGEEVTQQHQDLAARLKNARETETRLQAILEQRTGRISDVLEVEQEIARVRGEIESMEAEQAGLEHRVEFASVEVSLAEEYKAEFRAPDSVRAQLRNGLVAGYGNARDTVLGMVLFAEEYGPALLVWGLLLALPGIWIWRRYRRALRAG